MKRVDNNASAKLLEQMSQFCFYIVDQCWAIVGQRRIYLYKCGSRFDFIQSILAIRYASNANYWHCAYMRQKISTKKNNWKTQNVHFLPTVGQLIHFLNGPIGHFLEWFTTQATNFVLPSAFERVRPAYSCIWYDEAIDSFLHE